MGHLPVSTRCHGWVEEQSFALAVYAHMSKSHRQQILLGRYQPFSTHLYPAAEHCSEGQGCLITTESARELHWQTPQGEACLASLMWSAGVSCQGISIILRPDVCPEPALQGRRRTRTVSMGGETMAVGPRVTDVRLLIVGEGGRRQTRPLTACLGSAELFEGQDCQAIVTREGVQQLFPVLPTPPEEDGHPSRGASKMWLLAESKGGEGPSHVLMLDGFQPLPPAWWVSPQGPPASPPSISYHAYQLHMPGEAEQMWEGIVTVPDASQPCLSHLTKSVQTLMRHNVACQFSTVFPINNRPEPGPWGVVMMVEPAEGACPIPGPIQPRPEFAKGRYPRIRWHSAERRHALQVGRELARVNAWDPEQGLTTLHFTYGDQVLLQVQVQAVLADLPDTCDLIVGRPVFGRVWPAILEDAHPTVLCPPHRSYPDPPQGMGEVAEIFSAHIWTGQEAHEMSLFYYSQTPQGSDLSQGDYLSLLHTLNARDAFPRDLGPLRRMDVMDRMAQEIFMEPGHPWSEPYILSRPSSCIHPHLYRDLASYMTDLCSLAWHPSNRMSFETALGQGLVPAGQSAATLSIFYPHDSDRSCRHPQGGSLQAPPRRIMFDNTVPQEGVASREFARLNLEASPATRVPAMGPVQTIMLNFQPVKVRQQVRRLQAPAVTGVGLSTVPGVRGDVRGGR